MSAADGLPEELRPVRVAADLEDNAEDLYEHAPCGYLSTLPDGTIIKVNATLLEWTGYTAADLVGRRRFADLLSVGGRIYHETHYAPLLRMQGKVREIALDMVCADGRVLPVLVNSTLRSDEAGRPKFVRTTVFSAADRRRYERELLRARNEAEEAESRARLLAKTLQATFIPPALPPIPGLDVAGAYRPAGRGDDVGGDFYDVFETDRGDWAVVLGDVCGKGAEAATVTALARYTLRTAAMRTRRPRNVLAMLNEALIRQKVERFSTVLYARLLRHGSGDYRLTVSSGGHPLPLFLRGDSPPVPVGRAGSLIGVLDRVELQEDSVVLGPGDVVVLYTDGVPEARRGQQFFGEQRLADLLVELRDAPAAAIAGAVVDAVVAFQDGLPRDDSAVVVVKVPAG